FAAGTTSYDVTLPFGTTEPPTVTATATVAEATIEITQAAALPGTATVDVTAQDGVSTGSYSVNFTVDEDPGGEPVATALTARVGAVNYNKPARVTVNVTAPDVTP